MRGRRADIREVLSQVRLGESDRVIVKALGVGRKTVRSGSGGSRLAWQPMSCRPPSS
jgi:hypothetical protein